MPVYLHILSAGTDEWVESPGKASMFWGQGDFVWYDDISEEEAQKYMDQIRKAVNKTGEGG